MLERRTLPGGLIVFVSPLLEAIGVPHAFTTRHGGVSPAPFDSLNLGLACGTPPTAPPGGDAPPDSTQNISANYDRLRQGLGWIGKEWAWVNQVHGTAILPVVGGAAPHGEPAGDALGTDCPDVALTIRVADCVPILLASDDGTVVAGVHAGWRGATAGVLGRALELMESRWGIRPHRVLAAVGACIGTDHFEVGPEVAREFVERGLGGAVHEQPGARPHIDLSGAVTEQLRRAGVPDVAIDRTDRCTFRDAGDFFSHRRDAGRTGRMAAVIAVAQA